MLVTNKDFTKGAELTKWDITNADVYNALDDTVSNDVFIVFINEVSVVSYSKDEKDQLYSDVKKMIDAYKNGDHIFTFDR